MLKLLLIDHNIFEIESLINFLNDKLHNKINVSKLYISNKLIINLNSLEDYDIIIINQETISLKELNRLTSMINPKYMVTIIISDECYNTENNNSYVVNSMDNAIILLKNLYDNVNPINYEIEEILNNFKFNKSSSGYTYIIDLISICVRKKFIHIPKLNILYNQIAKKYNLTTSKNIGWNIEKTINNMKIQTDNSIIYQYFKFPPSPKVFLDMVLNIYNKNIIEKNEKIEIN